jgi:8-oxo-dGTP pyrophosphatase MutT (NUDIX family)
METEADVEAAEAAWTAYANSLPGKRMGVGCLLFDETGWLLIVNPTYKPGWSIPGGAVDQSESPYEACQRELVEELGVAIDPGRLVCVDYVPADDSSTENVQFLFQGGTIDSHVTASIVIREEELSEWRFVDPVEAIALLRPKLGRRIKAVIEASGTSCLYLEAGEPIT